MTIDVQTEGLNLAQGRQTKWVMDKYHLGLGKIVGPIKSTQ